MIPEMADFLQILDQHEDGVLVRMVRLKGGIQVQIRDAFGKDDSLGFSGFWQANNDEPRAFRQALGEAIAEFVETARTIDRKRAKAAREQRRIDAQDGMP